MNYYTGSNKYVTQQKGFSYSMTGREGGGGDGGGGGGRGHVRDREGEGSTW